MREEGRQFGRVQTVSILEIGLFSDQQEEEKYEDAKAGLGSGNGFWGDACGRRMAATARRNRRRVWRHWSTNWLSRRRRVQRWLESGRRCREWPMPWRTSLRCCETSGRVSRLGI